MSATITVDVQAAHSIFDDQGTQLIPGIPNKTKHGPLVDEYLSTGLLTLVEQEETPADTAPKSAPTKSTRSQETAAVETQEN